MTYYRVVGDTVQETDNCLRAHPTEKEAWTALLAKARRRRDNTIAEAESSMDFYSSVTRNYVAAMKKMEEEQGK